MVHLLRRAKIFLCGERFTLFVFRPFFAVASFFRSFGLQSMMKYSTMNSSLLTIALLMVIRAPRGVVEAFCPGDELTNMTFQLDWRFNAQFAGIFLAARSGAFADAGVAMSIKPWEDGVNAVMDVAEGRADFACAEQNLIIAAQAAGAPIKAVATMFQASPYGLMAPPGSDLSSLMVLKGMEVGVHVDGVKVMALVKGVNAIDDINVTEIGYADKWQRAAAGEFAAVQCYVIDEPIGVATNFNVTPEVLRLSDFGLQSTAQTIVVSDDTLATKGDLVTGVLGALFAGWEEALADKAAAATIIVNEFVPEGSVYKDVAYQTRTLELLEPYVLVDGRPIGVIDPDVWADAANLMLDYGIVSALPELNTTLAVEFFEGPGVPEGDDCPSPSAGSNHSAWFSMFLVLVGVSALLF
jgi:ABC-type nitrate/sulfonate/bicarbonate transport system substrate-binding protein